MRTLAVFMMIFLPVVALAGSFDETRRLELSVEGIQKLKICSICFPSLNLYDSVLSGNNAFAFPWKEF